jgi:hypothetical protein
MLFKSLLSLALLRFAVLFVSFVDNKLIEKKNLFCCCVCSYIYNNNNNFHLYRYRHLEIKLVRNEQKKEDTIHIFLSLL